MNVLRDITAILLGISITFLGCAQWRINCRLADLEQHSGDTNRELRQHENFIRICLDSIQELANPGSSITVENTVPEVRK